MIVILLSTINPLTLAWQRFAGTALGAALGALIATFFSSNWIVYGAGIFVCGIVCSFLRVESAYRFAAITLSIVLLIAHERAPWIVASHRFVEVSLGIAVALLTAEVWRVAGRRGGWGWGPVVVCPAGRKVFGYLPSPHSWKEPNSLYHRPSGALGFDSFEMGSCFRSSRLILRSRIRSMR